MPTARRGGALQAHERQLSVALRTVGAAAPHIALHLEVAVPAASIRGVQRTAPTGSEPQEPGASTHAR